VVGVPDWLGGLVTGPVLFRFICPLSGVGLLKALFAGLAGTEVVTLLFWFGPQPVTIAKAATSII